MSVVVNVMLSLMSVMSPPPALWGNSRYYHFHKRIHHTEVHTPIHLIKKPGLDREMIKNYRPVSNLSFLSKVIEKVISIRILGHILDNNIVDSFQSAYRAGHSCETALLRVYNDIVTTVGKGNGSFLVLLDLSAAFDTIDHDNVFYILEKYVGIGGSALRLIRSYFSDRTQRVQIDGIMSDFASLLCGVPQGSVLGPMKF